MANYIGAKKATMEEPSNYIQLVLEDNYKTTHHIFYSTDELEDFLKHIDLHSFIYKNIIVSIDDELNWEMTKIYKKRYIELMLKERI